MNGRMLPMLCLWLCLACGCAAAEAAPEWADLLARYDKAIQSGDDELLAEPHVDYETAAYLFRDLDDDGEAELMILETDGAAGDGFGRILACFTRKDGRIVHVFDGWDRNWYALCRDNTIYNAGSNGADNSIEAVYRLDGTRLQLVRAIYIQGENAYYTESEEALAQWGSFEHDPVTLGARRISGEEFSAVSRELESGIAETLPGMRTFRNER